MHGSQVSYKAGLMVSLKPNDTFSFALNRTCLFYPYLPTYTMTGNSLIKPTRPKKTKIFYVVYVGKKFSVRRKIHYRYKL